MPTPRRYPNAAARQAAYRQRVAENRHRKQQARGFPPLPPLPSIPGKARWEALIQQAQYHLATVQEEMQAYQELRSERWQESERGETFGLQLQAVTEVQESLEELAGRLVR